MTADINIFLAFNNIPLFNQCGKSYTTKASLRNHVNFTHKNEDTYPCTLCDFVFKRKQNMTRHIKDVHHKIKDFKCEVCSQAFCSNTVSTSYYKYKYIHKYCYPPWSSLFKIVALSSWEKLPSYDLLFFWFISIF